MELIRGVGRYSALVRAMNERGSGAHPGLCFQELGPDDPDLTDLKFTGLNDWCSFECTRYTGFEACTNEENIPIAFRNSWSDSEHRHPRVFFVRLILALELRKLSQVKPVIAREEYIAVVLQPKAVEAPENLVEADSKHRQQ